MKFDNVIVGGGLAGLVVARELIKYNAGSICIIEKEKTFGGMCRTSVSNGIPFDVGGHAFQNIDSLPLFYRNLVQWATFKKNSVVVDRFGKMYEGAIQDFIVPSPKEIINPSTLLDFYNSRFGEVLTELFFRPYNEKLFGHRLEHLSSPMLHSIRSPKAGEKSYNGKFFYPSSGNGIESYIHALVRVAGLDNVWVVHEEVVGIEKGKVQTESSTIEGDRIFVSAPIRDFRPSLFTRKAPTVTVVNGFGTPLMPYVHGSILPENWSWVYLAYPPSGSMFRFGNYNAFSKMTVRMPQIPFYAEMTDEKLPLKCVDGMFHSVLVVNQVKVKHAYPVYHVGGEQIKDDYILTDAEQDVFWVGRYGKDRWFSMVETIHDAIKTTELALG